MYGFYTIYSPLLPVCGLMLFGFVWISFSCNRLLFFFFFKNINLCFGQQLDLDLIFRLARKKASTTIVIYVCRVRTTTIDDLRLHFIDSIIFNFIFVFFHLLCILVCYLWRCWHLSPKKAASYCMANRRLILSLFVICFILLCIMFHKLMSSFWLR